MSSQHVMHRDAWFGARSWLLNLLGLATAAAGEVNAAFSGCNRIRDFDVTASNTPAANKAALPRAIDRASPRGAAFFVGPTDEPYPVDTGLVPRMNVSIVRVHGPVGLGTRHSDKPQPVGSVFRIEDETQPFVTEGQGHSRAWIYSKAILTAAATKESSLVCPAFVQPFPPAALWLFELCYR